MPYPAENAAELAELADSAGLTAEEMEARLIDEDEVADRIAEILAAAQARGCDLTKIVDLAEIQAEDLAAAGHDDDDDRREDTDRPVWLGTMDFAGYTLTVIAETKAAALDALRAEHERSTTDPKSGAHAVNPEGTDPLEWHGGWAMPFTLGAVQWL